MTKVELGLPPFEKATERQKKMECVGKMPMNYIMMGNLLNLLVV